MDSMLTEVSYMAGPALAVMLATQVSTTVALRSVGGALLLGGAAQAWYAPRMTAPSGTRPRRARYGQRAGAAHGRARDGWRRPGFLAVLGCTLAAGVVVSGFEISVIGSLRAQARVAWAGPVLSACGACALAGGLAYGALSRPVPVPRVIALLGLVMMPIGLVSRWPWLAVTVVPAAALSAPAVAATAHAASGTGIERNRAFILGLYGAAVAAGNALGAPMAGFAIAVGGPTAGFAAAVGLAVVAAAASWPVLRSPPSRERSGLHDGVLPVAVQERADTDGRQVSNVSARPAHAQPGSQP